MANHLVWCFSHLPDIPSLHTEHKQNITGFCIFVRGMGHKAMSNLVEKRKKKSILWYPGHKLDKAPLLQVKILFGTFEKFRRLQNFALRHHILELTPSHYRQHPSHWSLLYLMGRMLSVHLNDVGGCGAGIWPKVWLYEVRLACAGSAGGWVSTAAVPQQTDRTQNHRTAHDGEPTQQECGHVRTRSVH